MEAYSVTQKKHIFTFIAAFLLTLLIQAVPEMGLNAHGTSSLMFIGIIMAWALTINRRINQTGVRRLLILASFVMGSLFVLRQLRYSIFPNDPVVDRWVRLSYYLPYTLLPLIACLTSVNAADLDETKTFLTVRPFLYAAESMLCFLILTNPLHHQLFIMSVSGNNRYIYGPLYFVVVLWAAALSITAITLLILAGRRSPGLVKSHIPIFLSLCAAALIVWYAVEGGSPRIGGIKLYHIQEAVCLLFIAMFESSIEIGLISSNSGYEGLFCRSNMNAVILDSSGREVYTSGHYGPFDKEDPRDIRKKQISGGVIVWAEDYSAIDRLNEEIRSATEEIEDENELIRQEREIREERIRYETQNRLYDKIADTVRDQTRLLRAILREQMVSEEEFRRQLMLATLLGAYIKRCGNLMLLSDEKKIVNSEELSLSIRESMEYLRLSGCSCEVVDEGMLMLPGELLILAYELFERVLETAYPVFYTMFVEIRAKESFEMQISLDSPGIPLSADWKKDELMRYGAALSLRYEDETAYIRLSAGEAAL